MSDVENGIPDLNFSPIDDGSDDEIEIVTPEQMAQQRVEEEGDFASLEREELVQRLKEMKEQASGGEKGGDQEAIRRELEELKQNVQSSQSPQQLQQLLEAVGQQPQKQKGESEDEFRERLKDNFLEDPYQYLDSYMSRRLAPEIQRLMEGNIEITKKLMRNDPEKGKNFKKYEKQIEEKVKSYPPQERLFNKDIYEKAYKEVVSENIDDLIEEKVRERLEALERSDGEKSKGSSEEEYRHTEVGGNPNPSLTGQRKKKRVVLTDEDREYCDKRGIPYNVYAARKK